MMKYNSLYFLGITFGVLSLMSCSSTNNDIVDMKQNTFTINASLPTSRTSFDYDAINKKVNVLWSAGDKITLVNSTTASSSTFETTSGGSTSANFTGSLSAGTGTNQLYAFYPAVTSTGSSASFDCSMQKENQAVMYAQATADGSATSVGMSFSNAMAVLRLTLTLPSTAVTISSVRLSGTGLINGGSFDIPTSAWSNTTEGDIRIDGSWTPSGNKITVYAHLIPQTLPALNIIVSDGTNTYIATTSSTPTIVSGTEYPINKTVSAATLMNVTVGSRSFTAILNDNTASGELKALLPLTLTMTELNGNEKYNYLDGKTFTTNASNPGTINAGEIKLYTTNCLVLFYQPLTNSYTYTPLGYITDVTGLADALGTGNPTVTFALQSQQPKTLSVVNALDQQTFAAVTGGNFSGITHIGTNQYAVVDDKSATDGFYLFTLDTDATTGSITSASKGSLITSGNTNRDSEGIVYVPSTGKLLISAEADKKILEYNMDGTLTGRSLNIPAIFSGSSSNAGFEALAYNANTHLFWTTTESTIPADGDQATSTNGVQNKLRIQCFNEQLQPTRQYAYLMDTPTATTAASQYAMGVSDMIALDDGRLIVLEREFFVSSSPFVNCKLYVVNPATATPITSSDALTTSSPYLSKTLLYSFTTNTLATIANYEGMCLGPRLSNGNQTIILVSDSQANYGNILKDWFKVLEISGL